MAEAARNHFTSTHCGRSSTKPLHIHKNRPRQHETTSSRHHTHTQVYWHRPTTDRIRTLALRPHFVSLLKRVLTHSRLHLPSRARASLSSNEAHIIVQPKRLLRRRARPAIPYSFVVGVRLSRVGPSSSKRQTHALFRNNRNEVSSERATDTLSTLTQLVQHPFLIRSSRTCFAHTARELARVANEHVHTRPRTRNEGTHPKSWR